MRRLILVVAVAAVAVGTGACKRRDKLLVQATEEESQGLASVVHVADPRMAPQLVSGFYDVEGSAWRWTKSKFAVTLRPPAGSAQKGAGLEMKFNLPEPVTAKVGAVTVRANVGGTDLPPETFSKPGDCVYAQDVPGAVLNSNAVRVQFTLDKFLPPGGAEKRELGVIVTTVGFEAK
jgi:hypothetical protein